MTIPVPDIMLHTLTHSAWQWGFWHPSMHVVFEVLGYGASYYMYQHQPVPDVLTPPQRRQLKWWTLGGAIVGAKLVPLLELMNSPLWWGAFISGKSLAGGLLGGIVGSELQKARQGIIASTGDVLVLPLLVGTLVGRLGCSCSAIWDAMLGTLAVLPGWLTWASPLLTVRVSPGYAKTFPLEPTLQAGLYWNIPSLEIIGLLGIAVGLTLFRQRLTHSFRPGALFYVFCLYYSLLRLFLETLKHASGGMSIVQWVSLATLALSVLTLARLRLAHPIPPQVIE